MSSHTYVSRQRRRWCASDPPRRHHSAIAAIPSPPQLPSSAKRQNGENDDDENDIVDESERLYTLIYKKNIAHTATVFFTYYSRMHNNHTLTMCVVHTAMVITISIVYLGSLKTQNLSNIHHLHINENKHNMVWIQFNFYNFFPK